RKHHCGKHKDEFCSDTDEKLRVFTLAIAMKVRKEVGDEKGCKQNHCSDSRKNWLFNNNDKNGPETAVVFSQSKATAELRLCAALSPPGEENTISTFGFFYFEAFDRANKSEVREKATGSNVQV
ncbi:unnamed protein product, partial [Pleuronectes platessa]